MKKIALIFFMGLCFFLFFISCQKDNDKKAVFEIQAVVNPEVNVEKIEEAIGCSFDILRNEIHGYTTKHKFLWVCLDLESDPATLEKLAHAIIQDITTKKPENCHSFTIHFFKKEDLCRTIEDSYSFAKAEYLPKGGWTQVGRIPINEYENYQLFITSYNQ